MNKIRIKKMYWNKKHKKLIKNPKKCLISKPTKIIIYLKIIQALIFLKKITYRFASFRTKSTIVNQWH